jgi:hypothetical protein
MWLVPSCCHSTNADHCCEIITLANDKELMQPRTIAEIARCAAFWHLPKFDDGSFVVFPRQ